MQLRTILGQQIYQKRWIYRHNVDKTIRSAMNMGLVNKWWQWHMDAVKADKRKLDKDSSSGTQRSSSAAKWRNGGAVALKVEKLVSCFICWTLGLVAGLIALNFEVGMRRRKFTFNYNIEQRPTCFG